VPGAVATLEADAVVWGSATLDIYGPGAMTLTSGLWANQLKLAGLQLDGVATGSSFNASAAGNPYTAGIPITSAALDAGGGAGNPGLQNPRTGARFASL
jgi:hypothetical protein